MELKISGLADILLTHITATPTTSETIMDSLKMFESEIVRIRLTIPIRGKLKLMDECLKSMDACLKSMDECLKSMDVCLKALDGYSGPMHAYFKLLGTH
ncbi:uncharacterized protein EV154DRAFT_564337 [Mucor mucedo]|uniref:uncharacterized protein n=1 Tax=Mucor mucedo TaxID=29922 RepID=UPI00221EB6B2|nr:uncharacterized protein EV154DRAFT_564337 [Mucor mucedo]KAI7890457.1 hypothetical protein EV154DRAFT_564337 [Mucor mucedo]